MAPKKKDLSDSDSDSGPEDRNPPKKAKAEQKGAKDKPDKSNNAGDDNDEELLPLSKNRFISVSEFKGRPMVNIREYYLDANAKQRPGKKGISLSPEQWNALKSHVETIEKRLKKY